MCVGLGKNPTGKNDPILRVPLLARRIYPLVFGVPNRVSITMQCKIVLNLRQKHWIIFGRAENHELFLIGQFSTPFLTQYRRSHQETNGVVVLADAGSVCPAWVKN
jgi:hypothetical protein